MSAAEMRASGARQGVRKFIGECGVFAWRAILKMWRTPEQFADVLLQPILFTAMFGYLRGGAVAGSVKDYLPTLVPGVLVMSALTASMATGMQLREDMDSGVYERFRALPISRIAPIAGPMVADLARYAIAGIITFGVGMAMGYRPSMLGVVGSLALVVFAGWALAWPFALLGVLARSTQAVQALSMLVILPLTFLSNAFVPVQTLPRWLQVVVEVNPVSHLVTGVRDLAHHEQVRSSGGWAVAGGVVIVVITAPLVVHRALRR